MRYLSDVNLEPKARGSSYESCIFQRESQQKSFYRDERKNGRRDQQTFSLSCLPLAGPENHPDYAGKPYRGEELQREVIDEAHLQVSSRVQYHPREQARRPDEEQVPEPPREP